MNITKIKIIDNLKYKNVQRIFLKFAIQKNANFKATLIRRILLKIASETYFNYIYLFKRFYSYQL